MEFLIEHWRRRMEQIQVDRAHVVEIVVDLKTTEQIQVDRPLWM